MQLDRYRDFVLTDADYEMHLFTNDYNPVPGSVIGDYVECSFPGYSAQPIVNADWGTVAMAAHVASMTNATWCEFVADASGFTSELARGYYVTDSLGDYLWGERFEVEKTIVPEDTLKVKAVMRHGVTPPP